MTAIPLSYLHNSTFSYADQSMEYVTRIISNIHRLGGFSFGFHLILGGCLAHKMVRFTSENLSWQGRSRLK
jgi:hypothetical protein